MTKSFSTPEPLLGEENLIGHPKHVTYAGANSLFSHLIQISLQDKKTKASLPSEVTFSEQRSRPEAWFGRTPKLCPGSSGSSSYQDSSAANWSQPNRKSPSRTRKGGKKKKKESINLGATDSHFGHSNHVRGNLAQPDPKCPSSSSSVLLVWLHQIIRQAFF